MGFIDESQLDQETPVQPNTPSIGGTFISEADLDPETSTSDYLMGGLKGIAKSGFGVLSAPADLLYRGGMNVANAFRSDDVPLEGGYPSDRVSQFLEYISGGQGDKTTENITKLGGDLATAVMIPSQGVKIASKIPILSTLAKGKDAVATGAGLLAKALGFGAEGVGYSVLANAKEENPFKDAQLSAALNTAAPLLGEGISAGYKALFPKAGVDDAARAIATELRTVTPNALTSALSEGDRAALVAQSLESKGLEAKRAASALFQNLPENPVVLDKALSNINDFANQVAGPISPGSKTESLLAALSGLKPADRVISTPASSILDKFGKPIREAFTEVIPGGPAVQPLNKIQDTLRDVGALQRSAKGVDRAVLGRAQKEILDAAESQVPEEALDAFKDARSAWSKMKKTYEDGAVGSVRSALTKESGRLTTFKNKILNDPKSAKQLVKVMSPDDLENTQNLLVSHLLGYQPVSWERQISKKYDSYKAVFGKEGADNLLKMVGRDGTIGKQLLQDNNGLSSLFAKLGGKAAIGGALGYETGGDWKTAMLGAVIGSKVGGKGEQVSRVKSLIMKAAAGNPQALKILNTPATKMKIGEAVGRLATVFGAQEETTRENVIDQALNKAEAKMEIPDKKALVVEEAPIENDEFTAKVNKVSDDLGINSNDLMQAIAFETGGTFSSKVKNAAGSGATGLIQFMPKTAKYLTGKKTESEAIKYLESLSEVEQLDYVKEHLKPYAKKIKSFDDLYMAIFKPSAIGKPDDHPLFVEGTIGYKQNRGLDSNRDGIITKSEAAARARRKTGQVEV